jgi:hypothetical protein
MADVFFHRNFLSSQECNALNDWVMLGVENKWLDVGMSRGSDWEYQSRLTTRKYGDRFEYPKVVYDVFERITDYLGVHHLAKSIEGGGRNGVVVSYTMPNGDVYKHIDPMEGDRHVLRCNVMTQSADAGAELFIGGKKINIGVGDLHCYLPSDVEHYVTTAEGNTPRVMWMFGYQISKREFLQIKERAENALAITY